MAQAALSRPSLQLSSWSCIGPRRRASASCSFSEEEKSNSEATAPETETSNPKTEEIPPSSSEGVEWDSQADVEEDLMSSIGHEDCMSEVELWEQFERQIYNQIEVEETDVAKEIREEEAAALAEVGESQPEASPREMKEVHRFFPAGRILHVITLLTEVETEESEGDSTSSSPRENGQLEEEKVGIFLTPRTLYSKLRLSQTMISDHLMPVYRRQIEKLITELEKEEASNSPVTHGKSGEASN